MTNGETYNSMSGTRTCPRIRRGYFSCYYGQEYWKGTAKTETYYAKHEDTVVSLGLDLAMYKTELLLITGRYIPLHVDMSVGNSVIRIKSLVRYLEIKLNPRLTFSYQIQYSDKKYYEYWGRATGEKETPDGGWKRHYAIWKRNWAETIEVKKRANSLVSV